MFGQKYRTVRNKLNSIEDKVDHLTVSVKNKHEAVMGKLEKIATAVSKPKTFSLVWVKRGREPIPTEKG